MQLDASKVKSLRRINGSFRDRLDSERSNIHFANIALGEFWGLDFFVIVVFLCPLGREPLSSATLSCLGGASSTTALSGSDALRSESQRARQKVSELTNCML